MAECELDEIAAGCRQLNPARYAHEMLEAASRAGGEFASSQSGTDVARWDKATWRKFIWTILAAGVTAGFRATEKGYQDVLAQIDEIPFA